MDDINIPKPNKAIAQILMSPKMMRIVRLKTEEAKVRYQGIVAKRTGRLAGSARVRVFIGGYKADRWVSQLIVGDGLRYGASHEFGHESERDDRGRFVKRRKKSPIRRKQEAAKDLKKVLASLRASS
ncbi:hypothetical protein [Mycobacteroides abscessus]|uniref:hypothetical protein n=1 Tax=Mycobacteroides abscessus TaxID=36809 RepID=UPI000E67DB37|nr:hypothetical protein [Mycobacteroides abscessus]RIT69219.1 hypothetical protein D2E87_01315 [Mycobacteroides abscessus]